MTRQTACAVTTLASVLLCAATAGAAGLAVNETGPRGNGMANAVTAIADRPQALPHNPAGLVQLQGLSIDASMAIVLPRFGYDTQVPETGAPVRVNAHDDIFVVPSAFVSYRAHERVAVGFGVHMPYGLGIAWRDKLSDGTAWWRLHYSTDEEKILYEYLLDSEMNILKVRYKNPETGAVEEWVPEPSEEAGQEEEVQEFSEEDYARYSQGRETITVKAGTYTADHIVYEDEETNGRFEWWVTDEVPSGVVKYLGMNPEENSEVTGELVDVRTDYRTELRSY